MRVCVCAIDIGSILQSPWLLHLPARYCGVPVSLYEQQNYLYDYCPRMLLLVVLVGFSLRWLIGAAIEARPRPLSGTQPPLSLSLTHTHTHTFTHTRSSSLLDDRCSCPSHPRSIEHLHIDRVANALCVHCVSLVSPVMLRSLSCTSRSHGSRFCAHSVHQSASIIYIYMRVYLSACTSPNLLQSKSCNM